MSGKLFLYGLMVGVIASAAAADVELEWSPVQFTAGQTTTIELFVSASPGSDIGIGSIILLFSDSDPAIQLKDFRWIDELKMDQIYFRLEDLPDAIQTVYAFGTCEFPQTFCVQYPADGSKLKVAELDVEVAGPGSFLLDAGTGRAEFASAEGQAPLTIDDGLSVKLTVSVDSGGNDDPGSDPGGGGGGQEDNDNADDSTDEDEDGDDSTEDTNGDEDNANDDGESGEDGEGGDETDAGADELGGDDEGEGDSSGSDTSIDGQDESTDVDDTLGQIDGEESDGTGQPPSGFCGLGMIGFGFFTFGALSVMKLHRRRAA